MQTILNMEIDSVLFPYCTPSTYSDVLASVTPPNITLRADAVLSPMVKCLFPWILKQEDLDLAECRTHHICRRQGYS